jgi:hypothetical protein
MAEAVGIVLGVLPIIFEALKAYRSTYDKISTFRQCSKELEWIHMRLRVQKLRFFNSCWLLLHLKIEQDEKLQEMFAGESEQLWYDKDLNEQMDGALGIARDLCEAIVKDIKACLQDIERDLSCLETVRTKKAAVSYDSITSLSSDTYSTFSARASPFEKRFIAFGNPSPSSSRNHNS